MNLALEELSRDVDRGVALNWESLEVARKSGVVAFSAVAAANLGLALWTSGAWDDLEASWRRARSARPRPHAHPDPLRPAGLAGQRPRRGHPDGGPRARGGRQPVGPVLVRP